VRIEQDIKLDYSDVLFRPKRSTLTSRSDVVLEKTYTFRNSKAVYTGIPIMAANMDGVGTFGVAAALLERGLFTCLVKSYEFEDFRDNRLLLSGNNIAISTGISDADLERTHWLLFSFPEIRYVCIDVANGYSENFLDFVSKFREQYPDIAIIAGNVVTPDLTEELILRGADIVKVGIGPGSVCTTRIKTGVGYPQLSAVIECADAAHGLGGHIIADGGCSSPGDVAKAFGAGADFVMLGGMLAGTVQGGGDIKSKYHSNNEYYVCYTNGVPEFVPCDPIEKKFVQFYGMSSTKAQEKNSNVKDYRASEGRVVQVPFRGDIHSIVGDILGGIRSTCTYCGARSLKELPKRTTFIRVNNTHNRSYESITVGE
jgi:GMP reductase